MPNKDSFISDERYLGIFNDSWPPIIDGVTLTVQNYVEHLGNAGNKMCVVTPWNPEVYTTDDKVMRFFSLPIPNRKPYRYGYPKADPFIWSRLRNTPFKLIHAHCPFSSGRLGVYVARKQNIPLVATFHSKYKTDLEHSFQKTPWMVDIIMKRILTFFNSADHVWIPQASVEETIREYGFKGEITVMDNGSDLNLMPIDRMDELKRQAKIELGLDPEKAQLLFVGQHIWEKGIGVILDSLKLLDKINPDWHMRYIGTGYALNELKEKVQASGIADKIEVLGPINDRETLKRHYAAADLFLFPSKYDNAPLVVREAAAKCTPALLVKGSTASEPVTDGDNGFLALDNAPEYCKAINGIISDKSALAHAGVRAQQTFVRSWTDIVGEVLEKYEQIYRDFKHHII